MQTGKSSPTRPLSQRRPARLAPALVVTALAAGCATDPRRDGLSPHEFTGVDRIAIHMGGEQPRHEYQTLDRIQGISCHLSGAPRNHPAHKVVTEYQALYDMRLEAADLGAWSSESEENVKASSVAIRSALEDYYSHQSLRDRVVRAAAQSGAPGLTVQSPPLPEDKVVRRGNARRFDQNVDSVIEVLNADFQGKLRQLSSLRYDLRIYRLEDQRGTTRIILESNNIETTEYQMTQPLAPNTEYIWSVRARFALDTGERTSRWSGDWVGGHIRGFLFRTPE